MQEGWVNLKDLRLRYLEAGAENDRHILFIHGLGSSADRWLDIPERLSKRFHTIALDLPGFGKSSKSSTIEYTIQSFRDTIFEFLNEISIDGKTSIIGHSLGGYIAAEVAIENQDLLEKLVLIDSSGMLTEPTPLLEEYLQAAINPTTTNVRNVFEQMVADPERIPSSLVEAFISRIEEPNAKYSFSSTLEHSAKTQIGTERLQKINKVPTLILWGIEDTVIPPEHSRIFKENISNSQVEIIEDSGHAPFAEKPDQVYKLLDEFLK